MRKNVIKFVKSRDVKSPLRANPGDAGIDFFVPKFNEQFIKDLKEKNPNLFEPTSVILGIDEINNQSQFVLLEPGKGINIPSGIYCKMGDDRALIAFNKSGVATKLGLLIGACIIDLSYQGEIHINVINTTNKPVKIYEDQKLVQFIEMPVFLSDVQVDLEMYTPNWYVSKSERGNKGFGSTN